MFSLWNLVKETAAELITDSPENAEEEEQHSFAADDRKDAAQQQGIERSLIDTNGAQHAADQYSLEPRNIDSGVDGSEFMCSPLSQARPHVQNDDALKTPACQRLMVRRSL
jgi:hypothetical protein